MKATKKRSTAATEKHGPMKFGPTKFKQQAKRMKDLELLPSWVEFCMAPSVEEPKPNCWQILLDAISGDDGLGV